jgi:hypothetical protein
LHQLTRPSQNKEVFIVIASRTKNPKKEFSGLPDAFFADKIFLHNHKN